MHFNLALLKVQITVHHKRTVIKKRIDDFVKAASPHRAYWLSALIFFWILRLGAPFLIFRDPLFTFILLLVFDFFDYTPYMKLGFTHRDYNLIDKLLDFYSYVFMVLYTYGSPFFPIFSLLLFCRFLGLILFYLSQKHIFLFVLPNLIEPAFLTLILVQNNSAQHWLGIFILLVVLKMLQKFYLHVFYPKKVPLAFMKLETKKHSCNLMLTCMVDP